MKNNKKMIFALGLVTGACLMLIFSFAVTGIRTYIGRDIGMEERKSHKISSSEYVEEIPGGRSVDVKSAKNQLPEEEEMAVFRTEKPVEVFEERRFIEEISPNGTETEVQRDMPEQVQSGREISAGSAMIAEKKEESHREPEKVMTNEEIMKYYEQNKEYFKR